MNKPMNKLERTLEEKVDSLYLRNAQKNLNVIGRMLVDGREMSMWDHDTSTLPRGARKLRKKARDFARREIRPRAAEADLDPYSFDHKSLIKAAAKDGLMSLMFVPPFGRANTRAYFKNAAYQIAVVAEELSTEDGGLALMLMAHNLGVVPLLLSGSIGTITRHFLPHYIKSSWLGSSDVMAFAITEPGAGSDVEDPEGGAQAKLVTVAKKVKGGYVINGSKVFISGGGIADKVTVYAKLEGEDLDSWTCFIVEKGMKGFSAGRKEKKMGQRASDASELNFDNVFVPNKNIVGKLRSGWANNANVLNYSRPGVAAMALGQARGAFERSLEYCRTNRLGNKRLIDYREVQMELADMIMSICSARSTVWYSVSSFRCYQSLSSAAKVHASDTAFKVTNQAMELMGDAGYIQSYGVERAMRDSRLTQIYEGTNQMNRLAIMEHQWHQEFNKGAINI